jgi:hypothetical protein
MTLTCWFPVHFHSHPATAPVAEPYHLPDGKVVRLGLDVFRIPEFLFNPSLVPVRLPRVSLAQVSDCVIAKILTSPCLLFSLSGERRTPATDSAYSK